jgi:general secretion pathway protein J
MPRVAEPLQLIRRRRSNGFTLLELLVALTVFGFLMLALNHGIRTGLGIWDAQARTVNRTWDLDASARLVRALLTQIPTSPVASINPGSPAVSIAFKGQADTVSFVGELPTGFGANQPADITLELIGPRFVVNWQPHQHELGGSAPQATVSDVLSGVDRLEFAYWGLPSPVASAPTWLAAWDGPSLPDLIRVRVRFSATDPRRWPDLVVAPRL